jgi:hypothetical protein
MHYYFKTMAFAIGCLLVTFFATAQCPTCGNGVVDAGETNLNCPQDVNHDGTCTSPCAQPVPFESAVGTRQAFDFVGTTTYGAAALPVGWTFAGAPTATTAGALPAADAYGAKAGLVQPNCSGSCTATNGFCIGNIANSVAVGGSGTGGKLGANFDGRTNINANTSYAVLRGQSNPTLVSPTFNMSAVEGFKIQFWLNASETSCGQTNGWGSCVGNNVFLDFSANGGTSWTQIMTLNTSSTNTDMATNATTNTFWIQEGTWSRVCLTVFKTSTATANFYPAAGANTAPSGMMVNSAYFTNSFKFRIRYSQSASCTGTVTTTNPGRYLAIDYPVITSGNECIPCGLSFINMCGYGADNNDDGVGGSGTTTTTVFGTTRRSINNAERGVEILTSQTAAFATQNLTGSNFATNYDLCNAEGGDRQCINWETSNGFYTSVYEVLADFEIANVNLQYYKGTTPQSTTLTKVTAVGKTPTIGWRYSGNRFVSCGSLSDLNPGCNGYSFVTPSLPNQFIRAFYALNTNGLGQAYSYYGPSSATHYFAGPMFAPLNRPDTLTGSGNYIVCSGTDPVFTGIVDFCSDASGTSGSATLTITGPNGFTETIASGAAGVTPVIDAGDYTITSSPPSSPAQCLDCSKSVCVTLTAADLVICGGALGVDLKAFDGYCENRKAYLNWTTETEENNDRFIVERSTDGLSVEAISLVKGSGNTHSPTTYNYVDATPNRNQINYYRLRQVDIDGKETILKTIAIDCSGDNHLVITPIGSNGDFLLVAGSHILAHAPFTVYDLLGTEIASGNLKNGQTIVQLGKEKGLVFVRVSGEEITLEQRLVVE